MMGVFFMALAFGNLMAGIFGGNFDDAAITAHPPLLIDLFWQVTRVMLVAGVVVLVISKPLRKWMGDIR
jgi:proton-dependent oligopeptide transporter, POT family